MFNPMPRATPRSSAWFTRHFAPFCWSMVVLLALLSLLSLLGKLHWTLDLLTHFRVQVFQLALLFAGFCLWVRRTKCAVALVVVAVFNYAFIYPLYLGRPPAAGLTDRRSVRVLQLNLNSANRESSALMQLVEQTKPDLMVFAEVTPQWAFELSKLSKDYAHNIVEPRKGRFGMVVMSRHPLSREQVQTIGSAGVPSLLATVHLTGGDLSLIATHAPPPLSSELAAHRNNQLLGLAKVALEQDDPVLLVGDLNTSPWSPHFSLMLKLAGLKNSMKGYGFQPSWPAGMPFVRIPIDHVLHGPEIIIRNRVVGQNVGSDHLPVIVDFALR